MINLLPPAIRESYRYGRINRKLIHWITVMGLALAGAIVLTAAGYFYLQQTINDTEKQIISAKSQLDSADFNSVEGQVKIISNNLKLANQVLSKEILFSELLKRLGSVTPADTVLTNLSITQAQGGIDLTAQTGSYAAATQLQVNLSDPKNKIFSKADLIGINCNQAADNAAYPCTATLRALFAKDNPFLFINTGGKSGL